MTNCHPLNHNLWTSASKDGPFPAGPSTPSHRLCGFVLLLVLAWAIPVSAGSLSMHVAAGRLIGHYSRTPAEAFVLGFLSHGFLDTFIQDPVIDWQTPAALERETPFLTAEALLTLVMLRGMNAREWWGVIGSVAPDIIDGLYSVAEPRAWLRGELLMPWHRGYGIPTQLMSETASTNLSIALTLAATRF